MNLFIVSLVWFGLFWKSIRKKGLELAKKFIMGLGLLLFFLLSFFSLGLDTENTSILQKDAPVRKFSHNSSLPFDKDGRRKKSNAVVE